MSKLESLHRDAADVVALGHLDFIELNKRRPTALPYKQTQSVKNQRNKKPLPCLAWLMCTDSSAGEGASTHRRTQEQNGSAGNMIRREANPQAESTHKSGRSKSTNRKHLGSHTVHRSNTDARPVALHEDERHA